MMIKLRGIDFAYLQWEKLKKSDFWVKFNT